MIKIKTITTTNVTKTDRGNRDKQTNNLYSSC